MQRQFTKDAGARFKEGDVRDYPRETWNTIRDNLGYKTLDAFSREVNERPVGVAPAKGKARTHPQGAAT